MDEDLLSRVEDAGINASAPPQQRWLDGWLVRYNPGKAKRARCINAVAQGRLPVAAKLQLAQQVYAEAGLPLMVRITPFSQPAGLDGLLAAAGFSTLDDTRVMVSQALATLPQRPLPPGAEWRVLSPTDYAEAVGAIRASPQDQRAAHAERLCHSPVPYRGFAILRLADLKVLACGQLAREGDLVGLYDVATAPGHHNQGLASLLCERLLSSAFKHGARAAYLQVEADNAPARHLYTRLGFRDGYAYHYRLAP